VVDPVVSGGEREPLLGQRIVDLPADEDRAVHEAARILTAALHEHWPESWPDQESALEEVRSCLEPERICRAVMDEAGSVYGWIGGIPQYRGRVWELHPLVVRPDMQRRGIGTALVRDLEERVADRGGLTLWLGSDDVDGMTTLHGRDLYPDPLEHLRRVEDIKGHPFKFYLRCGFALAGVVPDANGPGQPDLLMTKRIGRGAGEPTRSGSRTR
jgi:aminoglycoside 6'-N-acetyltransferase I